MENKKREELIQKRLREKLIDNHKCPCCGKNKLSINNCYHVIPAESKMREKNIFNPQAIPYIVLICDFCGYSRFFTVKALLHEGKNV